MPVDAGNISQLKLFENTTHLFPKDVFVGEKYCAFIVPTGTKGKAIGHLGANVKRLKTSLNCHVVIAELHEDPKLMITTYFENVNILNIKQRDGKYYIYVPDDDRGKAIGKDGYRIKALKEVFKKYFNSDITIKAISVISRGPQDSPGNEKTIGSQLDL